MELNIEVYFLGNYYVHFKTPFYGLKPLKPSLTAYNDFKPRNRPKMSRPYD